MNTLIRLGYVLCVCALAGTPRGIAATANAQTVNWNGTWACSPQLVEPGNRPPAPGFVDATLRQLVRVSIGGNTIRLRISNAFGSTPLELDAVHLARPVGGGAIDPSSDRAVTFHGETSVTIPAGALMVSDPLEFELAALSDVAVTIQLDDAREDITGHPGSRTTSYLASGDHASAPTLPDAIPVDHWYFINGIDVVTQGTPASIVTLGDSITDGRGSTTNGNDRWPDQLAHRLQASPDTAHIGVLNHGIGGNRLLGDGLGPNALARFDRDVLAQTGVRWLIVFEGINDLGTRTGARTRGEPYAEAGEIIAAYEQFIVRAHAHGIRVYGGTILPFEDSFYFTPELEADRQVINQWMRSEAGFDAVIDFDAALRDPEHPTRLLPAADVGDHLHLNPYGYRMMAEAIDLKLFLN